MEIELVMKLISLDNISGLIPYRWDNFQGRLIQKRQEKR